MKFIRPRRPRRSVVSTVALLALVLAACGEGDDSGDRAAEGVIASGPAAGDAEVATLDVVASFYPLQFIAEEVGGDRVNVSNLTPAGGEPHDLELTPQDTATLQDAQLLVFLSGFTPAVDAAVENIDSRQVFDVAPGARLDLEAGDEEHADEEHADEEHADEEHADEEHADDEHSDEGGTDPHFWLDPTRLADVADALAVQLGELDPDHADEFSTNASTLRGELEGLDGEFETVLASCANRNIVTSHTAFGYLAQRYDLTQVGISGLSPEEEPSPARLAEVTEFVRDNSVSTIYFETLVDPAIAETVAGETGAATAVLDPLEGLSDQSAGADFFEVMRSNLESLRTGQDCT